jgi:hypothetical protein
VSDLGAEQTSDPHAAPSDAESGGEPAPIAAASAEAVPPRPRPIIERIGLGAVALLLASLFGLMAVAAFVGGELFLAVMSGIGCLMVVWVGGLTLLRGR